MNKYELMFRKGCRSIDMAVEKAIIKEEQDHKNSIHRPILTFCHEGLFLSVTAINRFGGRYRKCWDVHDVPIKHALIEGLKCSHLKSDPAFRIPLLTDVVNLEHEAFNLYQAS